MDIQMATKDFPASANLWLCTADLAVVLCCLTCTLG